jgi:hypothetical protein
MKNLFLVLMGLVAHLKYTLASERGSFEITEAMVDMFSSNVMHLSQQKNSRLMPYVRIETQSAETAFYDRIGKRQMQRKEGRHSEVVYTDTPHSRRAVTLEDWFDSDLIDQEDKLRVIMNPDSEYAIAFASALARQYDLTIIDAALGSAYAGKKGQTAVILPLAQQVAAVTGAGAFTGLNVPTLRKVRKKFKQSEAIEKGEKIIFVMSAQQSDDLLGNTEVTSADFNTVRALVQGEVNTYMGMEFVETELLPFNGAAFDHNAAGDVLASGGTTIAIGAGRVCFAMTASRGVLLAKGREVKSRITEESKFHFAHQVYSALSVGGTRMEEEQVVAVYCKED